MGLLNRETLLFEPAVPETGLGGWKARRRIEPSHSW